MNGSEPCPVTPVEQRGKYVFEFANLGFEVDPRLGGRITAFRIDGRNFLSGPDVHADNHGSTFWTSPQVDWDWPPVAEIDSLPYAATVSGSVLRLTGPVSPRLQVSVTKQFSADAAQGSVSIEYVIENHASSPRKLAPWEITRVRASGVTFFPTGLRVYGSGPFHELAGVKRSGETTWFRFDHASVKGDQKLYADGAGGWIAHADEGAVLVKVFADIPPAEQAPGEGEIEIYANGAGNPARNYIEVEVQGPYREIAPAAASSWKMKWYLKKYPAGAQTTVGNAALLDFVKALAR